MMVRYTWGMHQYVWRLWQRRPPARPRRRRRAGTVGTFVVLAVVASGWWGAVHMGWL